jgi:hypothetical protein
VHRQRTEAGNRLILLMAVAVGLMAGIARIIIDRRRLKIPDLRLVWLVPVAFLPQWLAFHLPATHGMIDNRLAAAALVSSQAALLAFAWFNRNQPGFWALGIGLALNLLVISFNGGLMPVNSDLVPVLLPDAPPEAWSAGDRVGRSVILPASDTRLWWLSDHILLPAWFPVRKALSPGDVFIAGGAFWAFWALGEQTDPQQHRRQYET